MLAVFTSPAKMSLTKLSWPGIIKLFPARESLHGRWHPGRGRENLLTLFYSVFIWTMREGGGRCNSPPPPSSYQSWPFCTASSFATLYSCIWSGRSVCGEHLEGNTEEENNGYVVSKQNIHGSAGKYGCMEWRRRYSARLHPGFWTAVHIKTTWAVFPLPQMFASCSETVFLNV
jgi:hypothetical protein